MMKRFMLFASIVAVCSASWSSFIDQLMSPNSCHNDDTKCGYTFSVGSAYNVETAEDCDSYCRALSGPPQNQLAYPAYYYQWWSESSDWTSRHLRCFCKAGEITKTYTYEGVVQGNVACRGQNLRFGEILYSNEYLQSANGTYTLHLQTDGDLILYGNYDGEDTQIWSSGTGGSVNDIYTLETKEGGYLVIMDSSGNTIWSTPEKDGAWSTSSPYALLLDDGNLYLYGSAEELWKARCNPKIRIKFDIESACDGLDTYVGCSGLSGGETCNFIDGVTDSDANYVGPYTSGFWAEYESFRVMAGFDGEVDSDGSIYYEYEIMYENGLSYGPHAMVNDKVIYKSTADADMYVVYVSNANANTYIYGCYPYKDNPGWMVVNPTTATNLATTLNSAYGSWDWPYREPGSYCPTTYGMGAAAVDSISDCPSDWKSELQYGWWTNPDGYLENFWETTLMDDVCILNSYGMSISECDDLGCTDCDTC